MTNLSRITAKIFGETATATGDDPEIGQFGSALAGTYVGTTDVAAIQNLPAWSNGFIDSVTPSTQFPPLPEMTGFGKVLSYQTAYTMQKGVPEWDSGTTYYTGDFAKGVGEGKLYVSKVDNNLNHAVTDSAYWDEFISGGTSRNIGEIVTSTIPLTDAGLHLLDGTLISGSGSYADFVEYIGDLYDSGDYPDLFCTEANWQQAVATYGVCGKFVYDSVNNTVRLPKITGKVDGTTDLTALGDLVAQYIKLPNITGTFGPVGATGFTATGAFARGSNVGPLANSGENDPAVTFDASRSSSIYSGNGTDTDIHEQAINVLFYIVIATTTKTQIEVDIDEIATDLNGKADVDLTNCTTLVTVHCVVETYINGTSWYRVYDDGWCEQGGYIAGNYNAYTTVNLLKSYINTNYNVQTTTYQSGTGNRDDFNASINSSNKSTSSFQVFQDDFAVGVDWRASGYIA